MKVFLAGEGSNELGGLAGEPVYHKPEILGVVEALLRLIRPEGWTIVGAVQWKNIRKLRVNVRHGDAHNIKAAVFHAKEQKCDVIAFVRDRDGDTDRGKDVLDGIEEAQNDYPNIRIVGGLAIEKLEAWMLALGGKKGSETQKHPEKKLVELSIADKDTAAMVQHVESSGLGKIPDDAESLRAWLARAKEALAG